MKREGAIGIIVAIAILSSAIIGLIFAEVQWSLFWLIAMGLSCTFSRYKLLYGILAGLVTWNGLMLAVMLPQFTRDETGILYLLLGATAIPSILIFWWISFLTRKFFPST